jgi:ribose transport system substrate-binding protein
MRRRNAVKMLVAGLMLAAGMSATPIPAAADGEHVALFLKNITNPYWRSVRIGGEKAAAEHGLKIDVVAPTKPDNIEEQTRLVEDWIVRKPDIFVFVPVDFTAMVPTVQKVNKAGIPIVNFSNRVSDVDLVSYVGSDDFTIGYEISKHLFDSLGGKGKVIHVDGVPAAITAQQRKAGFEKALSEYPEIELLTSQPANYRRLPAVQLMENLMQRFPEIDGVMSANDDMAVGIVEALYAAGRGEQTKVVGVDVIPDAAQLIKEGKMFASADYSGHDQAYIAVTAAAKHLRGESVPSEIILPVTIVTKDNVDPWLLTPEEKPAPDWDKATAGLMD